MKNIAAFLHKIERGEKIIYRGHADAKWELKPSIGRHFSGKWADVLQREIQSLDDFKNKSVPYLKHKPSSDIEWLCLMQHHGCATRLLDFTTNPLIALFFASDPTIQKDGEVIIATYNRQHQNVSNENIFERTYSFVYYPPHITERIIGQSGCFVYSSKPNYTLNDKQIRKITIPKTEKHLIRNQLKKIGVSQSTLFPGLDGICKDINDSLILDLMTEDAPF